MNGIKTKHTLLVADACFSGGIFKTRSAFGTPPAATNALYNLPSRKAMTSGTLTEVPDKSVFVEYLINHPARRPPSIRRGSDHPQYKHGECTQEAREAYSEASFLLRQIEDIGFRRGLFIGNRTPGRKPDAK